MPIDVIQVERVDPTTTWAGIPRWHVSGVYTDGRLGIWQGYTFEALVASLCDRSRVVAVTWKDARAYEKHIVAVEIAREEQSA